ERCDLFMFLYELGKKIFMIVLLVLALGSTFTVITNVTVQEVVASIAKTEKNGSSHHLQRDIIDRVKYIKFQDNQKTYVSSEEVTQPATLEETLDLSQYEKQHVIATGYTAGVESTGKSPDHPAFGITYSGVKVTR